MFVVHNDMTIYATRGDVVYFSVEKKVGEAKYQFQPGDIVRIRVCEKKNYSKVFLLKDFEVEEAATSVNIFLDKWEMKFGEIINKPTEYWYEVELNPDTYPDTIIGHNENGPAIFKLFPEAKDVVEGEIPDPEENSAVSRMVVHFVNEYLGDKADIIIQEILKEEYIDMVTQEVLNQENIEAITQEIIKEGNLETIVYEILKEGNIETILREILKEGNVDTIIQEIVKEGNLETIIREIVSEENIGTIVQEITKSEHIQSIVQEVLKPENKETIIQEILKPENTQVIVEQVLASIPVQIWVEVNLTTMTASHTSAQIMEHLDADGTAAAKLSNGAYAVLYGVVGTTVMFRGLSEVDGQAEMVTYAVWADGSVTMEAFALGGASGGKPFKEIVVTENADGSVTMENTFTDDSSETIVLAAGDKPASITYNGVAIPVEWRVGA